MPGNPLEIQQSLFVDPDGVRNEANFVPGKAQLADAGKAKSAESRFA